MNSFKNQDTAATIETAEGVTHINLCTTSNADEDNELLLEQNTLMRELVNTQRAANSRHAILHWVVRLSTLIIVVIALLYTYNYWYRNQDKMTVGYAKQVGSLAYGYIEDNYIDLESAFNREWMKEIAEDQTVTVDMGGDLVTWVLPAAPITYTVDKPFTTDANGHPFMSERDRKSLRVSNTGAKNISKVRGYAITYWNDPYWTAIMQTLAIKETHGRNIAEGKSCAESSKNSGGYCGNGVFQITHPSHRTKYGATRPYDIKQSTRTMGAFMHDLEKHFVRKGYKRRSAQITKLMFTSYNAGSGNVDKWLRRNPNPDTKRKYGRSAMHIFRTITDGK